MGQNPNQKNKRKKVKQAVDEIEDYVAEEADNINSKEGDSSKKNKDKSNNIGKINGGEGEYSYHSFGANFSRKLWLWTVVILFTIAIVLMWIFSLNAKFYDLAANNSSKSKKSILSSTQKNLNQITDNLKRTRQAIAAQTTSSAKKSSSTGTTSINKQEELEQVLDRVINTNTIQTTNSTKTNTSSNSSTKK